MQGQDTLKISHTQLLTISRDGDILGGGILLFTQEEDFSLHSDNDLWALDNKIHIGFSLFHYEINE